MRLRIFHTTSYQYASPASESHNEARLMPMTDADQTCESFKLTTSPTSRIFHYDLPTGRVHHFNVRKPHTRLAIFAESSVFTHRANAFQIMNLTEEDSAYYLRHEVRERYAEYLVPTFRAPFIPSALCLFESAKSEAGGAMSSVLIALNRLLHREFKYDPNATEVNTPLADVLESRRGVCQDFTHLMLSLCRQRGIPARYTSGYIVSRLGKRPSEEDVNCTADLVGGEAMHAWVECLLSTKAGERWIGFDPTNGILANDSYVRVHVGRDYSDVPPLRGVFTGRSCGQLDVVLRVVEDE